MSVPEVSHKLILFRIHLASLLLRSKTRFEALVVMMTHKVVSYLLWKSQHFAQAEWSPTQRQSEGEDFALDLPYSAYPPSKSLPMPPMTLATF